MLRSVTYPALTLPKVGRGLVKPPELHEELYGR
jgi:hypothetical protein